MKDYICIFFRLAQKINRKQMNAVLEAIMENRDMNLKNIKGVALQQLKRVEPQWEMIIK